MQNSIRQQEAVKGMEVPELKREIQPERKKGKWIRSDNGTYSCSLC